MRASYFMQAEWAVIGLVLWAGCGAKSDPDLSSVRGKITLDGKPLVGARVEFTPLSGSPSYGTTDEQGAYSLRFTRDRQGATVGTHVVRIRTFRDEDETGRRKAEQLPDKYNARSELRREVAAGANQLDFELSSKGKVTQPDVGK